MCFRCATPIRQLATQGKRARHPRYREPHLFCRADRGGPAGLLSLRSAQRPVRRPGPRAPSGRAVASVASRGAPSVTNNHSLSRSVRKRSPPAAGLQRTGRRAVLARSSASRPIARPVLAADVSTNVASGVRHVRRPPPRGHGRGDRALVSGRGRMWFSFFVFFGDEGGRSWTVSTRDAQPARGDAAPARRWIACPGPAGTAVRESTRSHTPDTRCGDSAEDTSVSSRPRLLNGDRRRPCR